MGAPAPSTIAVHSSADRVAASGTDSSAVIHELETVLEGAAFRQSTRSKQFLSFVVRRKLEGREELLKERTIGTELFRRRADYSTGDDPIVRVQAGEVRRKLEHHYETAGQLSHIRIELPVGSYVPEFHVRDRAAISDPKPTRAPWKLRWKILAALPLLMVAIGIGMKVRTISGTSQHSLINEFWAPALSSPQPVLICMSKPVLYRPSPELYRRYSSTHPGTFQTEVERMNQPLPLDPNQRITWKDMLVYSEFGVAAGDAYAGFRISALLGKMDKPAEFRIGSESSFDDLRNSPAVIIGAFSNRWTLEVTSGLRYAFNEKDYQFWIEDRNSPANRWYTRFDQQGGMLEDFGIANRLVNSRTGQLVITVAGIRATGSDAAAQLISNPVYLKEALRSAPLDWKNKNIQFVVKTGVVDGIAGPPQVVAAYFW